MSLIYISYGTYHNFEKKGVTEKKWYFIENLYKVQRFQTNIHTCMYEKSHWFCLPKKICKIQQHGGNGVISSSIVRFSEENCHFVQL